MKQTPIKAAALAAAHSLFAPQGDKAVRRLVIELLDGPRLDGPGWGFRSVVEQIERETRRVIRRKRRREALPHRSRA